MYGLSGSAGRLGVCLRSMGRGHREIITLPANHRIDQSPYVEFEDEERSTDTMIFGTNGVRAALLSGRRTFRHLYTFGSDPAKKELLHLAKKCSIDVVEVENKGVLNNMSNNRPHNGFVLECSMLDLEHIESLGPVQCGWRPIRDAKNHMLQSPEYIGQPYSARQRREYPVYILLDEISDPQNLGSVFRSAYFQGVEGLIMSSKNCAPISPVVVKASSGATEFLKSYLTSSTISFIKRCQRNDWTCIATVGAKDHAMAEKTIELADLQRVGTNGPIVIIFGSEGSGLRTLVKNECNKTITIRGAPDINPAIDSLNVGVSVGVILAAI